MKPASSTDLMDALKVLGDTDLCREQDIKMIPVLESKPKYVVYGPLAKIPLNPDVVLLLVRPDQTFNSFRSFATTGKRTASGHGPSGLCDRPASSEYRPLSVEIVGYCGARAYLDVLSDDTAIYAIPGAALSAFADRIAALSKANQILTKFHQIRRKILRRRETHSSGLAGGLAERLNIF